MKDRALYWTCQQCKNIGVVYLDDPPDIYEQVELILGDHADANEENACELDLALMVVSRTPTKRHAAAEREADRH